MEDPENRYGRHRRLRRGRDLRDQRTAEPLGAAQGSGSKLLRVALLGAGAVLFVACCALALAEAESARLSLERARSALMALDEHQADLLSSDGRSRARVQLDQAALQSADAAQVIKGSILLSAVSQLPVVGRQVRGAEDLARDVHAAAEQGISLLNGIDQVDRASNGTTLSLSAVSSLQGTVARAASTLSALERPPGDVPGPVGSARAQFNVRVERIVHQLDRGNEILAYLFSFLGGHGPRTYLLAGENQAEMRDQGSVLSVGQIHAIDGHLSVDTPVSVGAYTLSEPVSHPIPPGTEKVFGVDRPTQVWQSSNLTADFPWTGGDLVAMYKQATGTTNDGVVAVDVHALAGLLSLSGPVIVPGISIPITSANVEDLLLNTLYQQYATGDQRARKDELAVVATATFSQLTSEHVDPASLAHVLAREVAGRHLLLYDTHRDFERTLRRFGASGAVDASAPRRTFHLAVENANGTKLDYFIQTAIHQHVVITSTGDADVTTSVTVTNFAPAGQSPSYQLGPEPEDVTSHVPGQYVGIVYLWSPTGSRYGGSTRESGLELSASNIDLLPGQSETVQFATVIPRAISDGRLSLHWIPQPTFRPQTLAVTARGTSVSTGAPPTQRSTLTKEQNFDWQVGESQ